MDREKGGIELLVLAIVIIASFILVGGPITFHGTPSQNPNQPINIQNNNQTFNPSQSLQIQGLGAATPSPATPAPTTRPSTPVTYSNPCPVDTGQPISGGCSCKNEAVVTCNNGQCTSIVGAGANSGQNNGCGSWTNPPCGTSQAPGTGQYCWLKPVIYLYPETATDVSVKIQTDGKIVKSDPFYGNGWENVLAFPNGTLLYNNKAYSELFYETDAKNTKKPDKGIVVETKDIRNTLYSLSASLGLVKNEQDELVDFWVPRLENLHKKYIFVSLVDKETKDKTDKVLISPKPDTMIEMIFYFKGLDAKENVTPLSIPKTPQRVGFTAVEWGGTIEQQ